jgi:flagellar protein FliO/FliZ
MNNAPGLGSFLWFLAILALIPVALWLLKRTPIGGAASNPQLMRSVAVLPLSQGQRIVTVEVGTGPDRRWLVLGVTPQQITALHSMAPQEPEAQQGAQPGTPAASFSQLIGQLRGKPPGGAA